MSATPKPQRLGVMDVQWLKLESNDAPMHVSGLFTFQLPEDAGPTFLRDLADEWRTQTTVAEPWSFKLRTGFGSKMRPAWVPAEVDLDYHFRHSALPAPGGELDFGRIVSQLHSVPLDLTRPVWEVHLIEGLENNRFAFYLKVHHSLIDGATVMSTMMKMLDTDPDSQRIDAPWTIGRDNTGAPPRTPNPFKLAWVILTGLLKATFDKSLVGPYSSPASPLSAPLTPQRRVATQTVPMDLMKRARKTLDATHNDVSLWLCSTALRRFLADTGQLPKKPLTAAVPVNIREEGDQSVGTNIGLVLMNLATNIDDPLERLAVIRASAKAAKDNINSLPAETRLPFTAFSAKSLARAGRTKLDRLLPPMFSLTISNVPGPREPRYFAGAPFEAVYPISLITRRSGLNITCVSVGDKTTFGAVGARDALPHLQHLALYIEDAAAELDKIVASRESVPAQVG